MKLMILHVLNTILLVVEAWLLLFVAASGLLAAFVQLQVVYQVPNIIVALMVLLFVHLMLYVLDDKLALKLLSLLFLNLNTCNSITYRNILSRRAHNNTLKERTNNKRVIFIKFPYVTYKKR
jgi:hypothetical protein